MRLNGLEITVKRPRHALSVARGAFAAFVAWTPSSSEANVVRDRTEMVVSPAAMQELEMKLSRHVQRLARAKAVEDNRPPSFRDGGVFVEGSNNFFVRSGKKPPRHNK